ncbi:iron complex transport system substrate-binding protein [Methanomicrobium sp. W14]|uniref:ABC transporter substrate-binding protein n=1 Tax=Methanomicrobium sp. W14 TaxID=2817839 RepID=UPI001AE6339A|nr:ABC transporter substrate-binding protein [Methanomicrobium sp. W14]MBP2134034.1 iron complex transport system substrate-binding protein [Methanomicrobium sp. W14]
MKERSTYLILLAVFGVGIICCGAAWLGDSGSSDLFSTGNSQTEVDGLDYSGTGVTGSNGTVYSSYGNNLANETSLTRTITDLAGREVTIPVNISKVLCTSPPPSTYVYMLAPDKLCGWQLSLSDEGMKYIPEEYRDIPLVGWKDSMNYEQYIMMDPDIVFVMYVEGSDISSVENVQEKLGTIPVVSMPDARNATEYDKGLRFMGDVLGVPEVADTEIAYYKKVLGEVREKVAGIPDGDRVRVYYAEGSNGLQTDPGGSFHSQLIDIGGGVNVADCEIESGRGMTEVTKESVLKWNPSVIITTSSEFYENVFGDVAWNDTDAVKSGRVYLTPRYPYNWFDRPPGVNRIVGIPWTAHIMYPEIFTDEWFESRAKEFYSVFYHYNLTDDELSSLIEP